MKKFVMLFIVAAILSATPILTFAGVQDRLFDFIDPYYYQNGVDASRIFGRRQVTGNGNSIFDTPNFWFQRQFDSLRTTGRWAN